MKLHADKSTSRNRVTAYGEGWIEVNGERHSGSLLLTTDDPVAPWEVESFDALTPDSFARLAEREPELVLFGSGGRQRFPHPRLTDPLLRRRIGVEVMDTAAACRTYNILVAEGRRVVAVLLPG